MVKYSMSSGIFNTYLPCGCQHKEHMKWFTHHYLDSKLDIAECDDCGATWDDNINYDRLPAAPTKEQTLAQYTKVVRVAKRFVNDDKTGIEDLENACRSLEVWEKKCKTPPK